MNQYRVQNAHNKLIISKARELGIGCKPLVPGCEDFLELSYRGKQIIINKTRSHKLSLMAGLLAKNKDASNLLFRRCGLPVPDYIVVSNTSEEAMNFLHTHPCIIVKPLDTSRSIGVTLGIREVADLNKAIQGARLHSENVMIQQYVEGFDYRVLVIAGKAVGVLEYRPAFIEGDGYSTIKQLVNKLNKDQLRRNNAGTVGSFQEISIETGHVPVYLQELGKTVEDILEKGEQQQLFSSANIVANEISEVVTDRTETISPINVKVAIEAAKALNIDVAGVDIRCKDISLPLTEGNGGILEVNALPDMIDPHLFFHGASQDVFKIYLQYLFEE